MKKSRTIILNVITIIFTITAFIAVASLVYEVKDANSHYATSEDSMYYALSEGDYQRMVEGYYNNELNGVKANDTMKCYYGIAMYYEAATRCKAEITMENDDNAAMWREKMDTAKSAMGDLASVKNDIDKKLGI